MYTAHATPTIKGYHPSAQWARYGTTTIARAATLHELIQKLAQHYGKSWRHKKPMYRDTAHGTVRSGWVVGMRMSEGGEHWLQQDWVFITECKDVEL